MTPDSAPPKTTRQLPAWTTPARYVLRHGWVGLCMVAVLATYVAVMLTRGAPWRGDLIWTIDWLPIGFVLAGPLIAGFVAVDTARLGVGVRHLPLAPARTFDLAVAATYAGCLGGMHLLFTAATLIVSHPAVMDRGAPLAVLVQLVLVWFFVALGSLVGRFAPLVLGGLGAALAALAAEYLFSSPHSPVGLLNGGAATTPRIGYTYDVAWLTIQGVVIAAIIGATWLVRPGAGRSRTRIAATTAFAVVVAIGGGAAVAAMPGQRLNPSEAQPGACGALAGVPWCYYPQHERVAGMYADNLLALFEAAGTHGYGFLVPKRVLEADQIAWPASATVGAFYVTPEALAGQRPDLWETATRLLEPAYCPQLKGDRAPADAYWDDLSSLTATWVGLVDPQEAKASGYTGTSMPPEQAGKVIGEFRTCTYPFG